MASFGFTPSSDIRATTRKAKNMIYDSACSHVVQYTHQSSLTQCPGRSCFNPSPRDEVNVERRDHHNYAH